MTVGINTEAINHKNIPFTMYDLGWVVLCIGAAIGSGIVFFPLQVGLKGVWVFALAVILGYPAVYYMQKLFIETIERNNIIQRRSVAVIFCRGIFEQVLVAGNQRKISIMVQRDSCCGIILNRQVLIFQFLKLLEICQKRFRHLHHPLRCEKGSPRRDSPGCRPREHLQLDHYGKYNARFCICQPENRQQNYVYSP